jgi:predicted O-methyltransferase YrrM
MRGLSFDTNPYDNETIKMIEYIPIERDNPNVIWDNNTWGDISSILLDIIHRFSINPNVALEFGVATGHSTSALACYFKRVIGVDTFKDDYSYLDPDRPSTLYNTLRLLRNYYNIQLIQSLFEDFIKETIYDKYDLIHIDIIHSYRMTYDCGEWSLQHSDCVIFHDTVSYPEVKRAVIDLADKYNFEFYNYLFDSGLGILIRK